MTIFSTALIGLFALSAASALPTNQLVFVEDSIHMKRTQTHTVTMTGYNAVPEQTDGDPHTAASGAYSNPEVIAARSADLAEELPFGTVVEIVLSDGGAVCGLQPVAADIGLRVIADSMHSRKRTQVDILFDTDRVVRSNGAYINRAVALGVCKDIEIRVVGHVDIKKIPKTQKELRLAVGYLPKAGEQILAISK